MNLIAVAAPGSRQTWSEHLATSAKLPPKEGATIMRHPENGATIIRYPELRLTTYRNRQSGAISVYRDPE